MRTAVPSVWLLLWRRGQDSNLRSIVTWTAALRKRSMQKWLLGYSAGLSHFSIFCPVSGVSLSVGYRLEMKMAPDLNERFFMIVPMRAQRGLRTCIDGQWHR